MKQIRFELFGTHHLGGMEELFKISIEHRCDSFEISLLHNILFLKIIGIQPVFVVLLN